MKKSNRLFWGGMAFLVILLLSVYTFGRAAVKDSLSQNISAPVAEESEKP